MSEAINTSPWADSQTSTPLADIRAMGEWMRERAEAEWNSPYHTDPCLVCVQPVRRDASRVIEGVPFHAEHPEDQCLSKLEWFKRALGDLLRSIDFSDDEED